MDVSLEVLRPLQQRVVLVLRIDNLRIVLGGDRSSLARSITLIESSRPKDQEQADHLLGYLTRSNSSKYSHKNRFQNGKTLRLGFAGPPGGGKSSLIEVVGMEYIKQGYRVAVIPIDPSSHRSGGSILGDKTRMPSLSKEISAYVRASPTKCFLGGIAEHTVDVMTLCESAGYDVVIVETVGLGQSEVELEQAVDLFCLLVSPGGGDDLQASKKGVMEAVDLLLISKADGDLLRTARHTKSDYSGSLSFIRRKSPLWAPKAQLISSRTKLGVDEFLENVKLFHSVMTESGELQQKRGQQARHWMWAQFKSLVVEKVRRNQKSAVLTEDLERKLLNNTISSRQAARILLQEAVGFHQ